MNAPAARPGEPSERWAGDPRFANEPQAKALDVERSALPVTAPGVSPRSNEDAVDRLAKLIRTVDGDHSLGAGALAEKLIEAGWAEREDQDRRIEELQAVIEEWRGYGESLTEMRAERDALLARAVAAEAHAEEAYSIGFEQVRRRCVSAESERDELRAKVAAVEAAGVLAKLGWSNPDTGPNNRRLYALDQGDSPRWARPRARVIEDALEEFPEGERFIVVPVAALAAASPGDEETT